MYNLNQEQIILAEQNECRLLNFINLHIHKLNQLLKCCICFELYNNPVTISNCLHLFCKHCIETYLEYSNVKGPLCPVCRKPFVKNGITSNNFLKTVIKCVGIVNNKLNAIYQDDVSNMLSMEAILQNSKRIGEIQSTVEVPFKLDTSSPALTVLLNAKKVLIGLDNNVISTVEQLPPMQSIDFRDGSVKTPITKKRKPLVNAVTKHSTKDAFDILKESLVENPFFKSTLKSYSVQKHISQTKNQNIKNNSTKVVPFEDDTNRLNVIKWLENSENKFEQIPLTQEKVIANEYDAEFDMPSVSQRLKYRNSPIHVPLTSCINKQKQEQNKIRKRNDIISRFDQSNTKRDPRRTRSLENSVKLTKRLSTNIKHHSVSVLEDIGENLNIEQFNSEEEGLKFPLNQVDNEINKENLDSFQTVVNLHKRGNSKVRKTDTTGWRRIKQFKKEIKKADRKLGKLRLTGVSRTSGANKGSNRSDNPNKLKKKEAVVVLHRIDFNDTVSKQNDKQNISRVYELDVLESYISNNIVKLTNVSRLEENKSVTTSPIKERPCVVENLQKEIVSDENEEHQVLCNNNTPIISSDNKENYKLDSMEKSRKRLFHDDEEQLITENDLLLVKAVKTNNTFTEPNHSIKQNQEIITYKTKNLTDTYLSDHDNLNKTPPLNNKEILKCDLSEDEFYLEPTQQLVENHNKKKPDVPEDDEIFKIATQIIPDSSNDILQEKLQLLTAVIQDLSVTSVEKTKSDMIKILKDAYESISATQEQSLKLNVQVPTSNLKDRSLFSQNAAAQTATLCPKFIDVAVQTDMYSSSGGSRIFSTGLFKTQAVVNTQIQTDTFKCPKCNYLIKDFLDSGSNMSLVKKTTEKLTLTGSFDNFYFETQDVLKRRVIEDSSLNEQKIHEDNSSLKSFKDIDNVKPEVSFKGSNINNVASKTSNELAMESTQKTSKRIRNPSVESDLDKVEKNPKKCKFIEEDISIYFVSQLEDDVNLSQTKNGKNTEHQECTNNILKQYLEKQTIQDDNSNLSSFKDINDVKPEVSLKDSSANDVKSKTSNELAIETTQKTSKRICKPSVESDLDKVEENPKMCKFIDEDIAIHFVSQLNEDINLPQTRNSENTKHQECTNNILKQYEENKIVPKNISLPSHTKQHKTEDIINECEHIINHACSQTFKIENTENYSVHLNNGNIPESSKLTLAVLEEEFQSNFCSEGNKYSEGEDAKNKHSETLFTSTEQLTKTVYSTNQTSETNKDANLLDPDDDFFQPYSEFNTSFENNVTVKKNVNMKNNKIQVLQDIILIKPNDNDVDLKVDELKSNGVENLDEETVKSDDMFISDSDVVDTTPEKKKPVPTEKLALLSQAYFNPESEPISAQKHPNIKKSLPLSCLNEVFLPPQEFQDTEDIHIISDNNTENTSKDKDKIQVKPYLSSLTPDVLMVPLTTQITDDSPQKKSCLITSTPYSYRSQIISINSLNISPIKEEETVNIDIRNPILAAQSSKSSPLTIVRSKTPLSHRLPTNTCKQKTLLNYIKPTEDTNGNNIKLHNITQSSEIGTILIKKKPHIACTRMNEYQLMSIISLANKNMISYSTVFSSTITHMIVDVNDKNCVKDHTMKFVCAVASGIWVLSFKWIQECLKKNCIVEEEPFEALDVSGIDGPKKARLNRSSNPLLKNFIIHAASPFLSTTQKEVENVIKLLGGEVVLRPDDLLKSDGKIKLIITEAKGSDDFDLYESWKENLKVLTVDLEWLSRSIGQYKNLSLKHFTLCSVDNIEDLGYPEELLIELSSSCA